MTNGIHDLDGGQAVREWDAHRGAFANDAAPGVDDSALGANTLTSPDGKMDLREALTKRLRGRGGSIFAAAMGFGLLALGTFLTGRARRRRPTRFTDFLLRSRPRRGLFAR